MTVATALRRSPCGCVDGPGFWDVVTGKPVGPVDAQGLWLTGGDAYAGAGVAEYDGTSIVGTGDDAAVAVVPWDADPYHAFACCATPPRVGNEWEITAVYVVPNAEAALAGGFFGGLSLTVAMFGGSTTFPLVREGVPVAWTRGGTTGPADGDTVRVAFYGGILYLEVNGTTVAEYDVVDPESFVFDSVGVVLTPGCSVNGPIYGGCCTDPPARVTS